AIVIMIILSALTWRQCGYWKNSFTLFSHALHVNEHNYQAHINLASYLIKMDKINEAISYYNNAIHIKPGQADAYNNRGIAYAKIGKYQQAANNFNKATELQPNNADIFNNRANFYLNQGNSAWGCRDAKTACVLGNCVTFIWAREKGLCN
ncbi:MAG: tetratricopeptide repeat protein, partial [Syntrophaceae bacterium]|nr:tetratricopeptide repeat protein [Syntrophaceae bacterium]